MSEIHSRLTPYDYLPDCARVRYVLTVGQLASTAGQTGPKSTLLVPLTDCPTCPHGVPGMGHCVSFPPH